MKKYSYPQHLADPLRRKIVRQYLQHELRKLFPSIRDTKTLKKIDKDIIGWYRGNPTLMPVRDFWNGVHGISMGFKLKNIVAWVTSKNISWTEENMLIDDIQFGATLSDLKPFDANPTAAEVRSWYFDSKRSAVLKRIILEEKKRGQETAPRNQFPIIVVERKEGLRVSDGNRRLFRAIITGQKRIKAVIGRPTAKPVLCEHWVPTSTLLDITSFHRYFYNLGRNTTEASAKIIAELIRDSSIGRYEWTTRCLQKDNKADQKLLTAVRKIIQRI